MAVQTGQVRAPEFPSGLDWLNTEQPLSLRDLRGKIILLDFWTYCCINCMHVVPELRRLEQKYARELVVIGVHSAKFTEERETENIRQAVLRYGIEHPVVNDRHMVLWRLYGIRSWPTLVLIDPEGHIVGQLSGEGNADVFDQAIAQLITDYDARRLLDRTSLTPKLEQEHAAREFLAYPGKVLADPASARLFIADTSHHRIVIASLPEGRVLAVAGSGDPGREDGNFATATFRQPQAMALEGETLYVADTGNHVIRQVDLEKRTVTTLAGTGEQARGPMIGGPAKSTPLNSPWGLALHSGTLYLAMAGSHQLWQLDLRAEELRPFAGTGQEARVDGPRAHAAFAQPSGLVTDGQRLYVADSEASSVRAVDLGPEGQVVTLAGGDLFDFGDRDGLGLTARFQHPLGLAYADGVLYLADTYNHKIKRLFLDTGRVETLSGTGLRGHEDGEHARFHEPSGVAVADGTLYVADTNNHAIRTVDIATGRAGTLSLQAAPALEAPPAMPEFFGTVIEAPLQTVGAGAAVLTASLSLPPGHTLTVCAPNEVRVRITGGLAADPTRAELRARHPGFPAQLPLELRPGEGALEVEYDVYYCQAEGGSACLFAEARVVVPVRVDVTFPGHALQVSFEIAKE